MCTLISFLANTLKTARLVLLQPKELYLSSALGWAVPAAHVQPVSEHPLLCAELLKTCSNNVLQVFRTATADTAASLSRNMPDLAILYSVM